MPQRSKPQSNAPDPIVVAIEKHKTLMKEYDRLYVELCDAEFLAQKKHGRQPVALITWRGWCIGGQEIDQRRDAFLREPSADRKQVEREYRGAKARLRAAERAGREWDKRAGIVSLRQQCDRAGYAVRAFEMKLAKTKPRTPVAAGALVAYTRADMLDDDMQLSDWHLVALATAAGALAGGS